MFRIAKRTAWLLVSALGIACGDDGLVDPGPGPEPGGPAPVWTVEVGPQVGELVVGASVQLTATPKDRNGTPLQGRAITWESRDTTVAVVSGAGLVTGRSAGPVAIFAASEGRRGRLDLVVRGVTDPEPTAVARVVVAPTQLTLQQGGTDRLTARTLAADGTELEDRAILWTSSDSATVQVGPNGSVSARRGGIAWIVAASEGVRDSARVAVPTWNESSLSSIEGNALPYLWRTFTATDEHGVEVTRRIRIVSGRLRVDLAGRAYEERTVQELWEDAYVLVDGKPVVWGVQLRETRTFDDHGRAEPLYEGSDALVFRSEVNTLRTFSGFATADGYQIEKRINGAGELLTLRFVR